MNFYWADTEIVNCLALIFSKLLPAPPHRWIRLFSLNRRPRLAEFSPQAASTKLAFLASHRQIGSKAK